MKTTNIKKNYIYNLLYQLFAIIVPIITTPYLSRVLGADKIGIYSYTISIITYFILFGSIGMAMYAKREIAYVQDDVEKRSKIFWEIFILKSILLTVSMIIFYILFCNNNQYSAYYKILLLEILANILDISWFFQGLEEFKKISIRNIIIKLIGIICIFYFVKSANDLAIYLAIYVVSNFAGNLALWLNLDKYIIKVKKLNLKKHIKPTLILFIPQIAVQIYTVLDKTMIGLIISNKAEVGFYEQSQKIIKILMTIATSLGTVMLPRIAATYAQGEIEKVKSYLIKSCGFIMMLAFPLTLGIISVATKFVPLFFGPGYEKVITLLYIISPIIIFISLSNITGVQYLLPTKQQNKYTLSVVIGAIVNFSLNLILIKKYASVGASIATVIAEFLVTTVQFVLIRKDIKITDIFKIIYKYIIASVVMFIVSLLVGGYLANNVTGLFIQVAISMTVYFVTLLLIKDQFLLLCLDKFKTIFKRKKNAD